MNEDKIWLSSPHLCGKEIVYIQEALDTNWVAPVGKNIEVFEQDLEHYLGKNHVTALVSGTAALHLGLVLLGIKAGDYVICQSMTFAASAFPILYQNATPVFVDSELDTWNLCPKALLEAIEDCISKGNKPKAIITVHLYGMPYKVNEIRAIADQFDIPILEDSAEAMGSTFEGKKCGTFGDVSVLSFNGNKIITTSGGGAIVTKTKILQQKALFLATQSRDEAHHYQHSELGFNYRMSNICAGIGRAQLEVLNNRKDLRREMHDFYVDLFENINGVMVMCEPNNSYHSNFWLTTILIKPEEANRKTSEDLRVFLNQYNIESRPLWKPMHLQPIFENHPYFGQNIAENLFRNGLCLPSGSNLSKTEKNRIKNAINLFFH